MDGEAVDLLIWLDNRETSPFGPPRSEGISTSLPSQGEPGCLPIEIHTLVGSVIVCPEETPHPPKLYVGFCVLWIYKGFLQKYPPFDMQKGARAHFHLSHGFASKRCLHDGLVEKHVSRGGSARRCTAEPGQALPPADGGGCLDSGRRRTTALDLGRKPR